MNLKELTWENHKKAERKEFAKILMSGKIPTRLYYQYLLNQFVIYSALEESLRNVGFDESLHTVFRSSAIAKDLEELEYTHSFTPEEKDILPVSKEYQKYIDTIKEDKEALISHMYVRHFGDMYGGSMIAKKIPGSGAMYQFQDKENLKAKLRNLLSDEMAKEANVCFTFAIKLFEELENVCVGPSH